MGYLLSAMYCLYLFFPQQGTPAQEAVDTSNNHPHIIKFADVTSDVLPQYFVAIEQQVLIECKNLERAIFIMLAVHYVFNMEYQSRGVARAVCRCDHTGQHALF